MSRHESRDTCTKYDPQCVKVIDEPKTMDALPAFGFAGVNPLVMDILNYQTRDRISNDACPPGTMLAQTFIHSCISVLQLDCLGRKRVIAPPFLSNATRMGLVEGALSSCFHPLGQLMDPFNSIEKAFALPRPWRKSSTTGVLATSSPEYQPGSCR